ncbi:MAG TPA: PQQ-binding-like beta-propeller repeat protein [Solirubrobacteraceae bacterium]|nr:PQQ-binding-like beta-propeller repeat protein [Solirubrobacteraceae bacterium]
MSHTPDNARRGARQRERERRRRRRRRQLAVRRAVALLAAVAIVAVVVRIVAGSGGRPDRPVANDRGREAALLDARIADAPAIEAGLLPWSLAAPISREVVLPAGPRRLLLLGGLNGSSSAAGVFALDTADGALHQLGSLHAPVHDAAGAVIGGRDVVFGGGSPATVATVQSFPAAAALGPLPAPRSDAASAQIGATTYVVGGYDGSAADAQVLATTDGRSFETVASLPVPVRYPAVAALGGKLYVFGGEAVQGADAGQPVDDIQVVDPAARTAAIVGHLPEPLQAATAVVLDGHIYLAGGQTTAPQDYTPGVGTTQLSPPVSPRGPGALTTVDTIWALDTADERMLVAGRLQVPVAHAGAAVAGGRAWLVGGESGSTQIAAVQMLTPNARFGTAGAAGAGSPYFGDDLLIADRANDRLLLLDPAMNVVWRFPSAGTPHDRFGFFFPDDAFFVAHGTAILTNQEENETIQEIAYPSGRVIWEYGHPRQIGTARGYLHEPDDAYLLRDGQISVADADNCRVLIINPDHTVAHQIGTDGSCVHSPPQSVGSPNGDTPLADGNLLISEINGSWVSEYTPTGHLVWTVQLPIAYPSDPQQLGPDRYLIADYSTPGQVLEFNRSGRILYRYDVASGPGMLNQPSLAERLPSGVIMLNDDYNDRMVAIDPATRAIVWQYGVTGQPGRRPGMLHTPDGFDLLGPGGSTPTHPSTG